MDRDRVLRVGILAEMLSQGGGRLSKRPLRRLKAAGTGHVINTHLRRRPRGASGGKTTVPNVSFGEGCRSRQRRDRQRRRRAVVVLPVVGVGMCRVLGASCYTGLWRHWLIGRATSQSVRCEIRPILETTMISIGMSPTIMCCALTGANTVQRNANGGCHRLRQDSAYRARNGGARSLVALRRLRQCEERSTSRRGCHCCQGVAQDA